MGFLDKEFFASKTWWGGVVAVLGVILGALGVDIDLTSLENGLSIMDVIALGGGLLGVVGLRAAVGKLVAFVQELLAQIADLKGKVEKLTGGGDDN